jgi:hypothetical protein
MVQISITCVTPQAKMKALNSHATPRSETSARRRTNDTSATGIEK